MVIMWQMQLLPLEVRHLKDKMYFLKTFHSLPLIVARSVTDLNREKRETNAGFVSMTVNFNNLVPSTSPFVQWNQGRRPGHEFIVYDNVIIYLNLGRVYRSGILKVFSHRDSGTGSPADVVLCSVTSCRSSGAKAFFPACLNWSLCPQVLLIWENQKAAN